ncbi:hypothetical protein CLU79DRAFT_774905 [Phycomyces nitens]|nr:hypothetical protein CLU79DRAFT_774905 [Phycomyces nitens]
MAGSILEGWLHRMVKKTLRKSWKRCYAVLSQTRLSFYKKPVRVHNNRFKAEINCSSRQILNHSAPLISVNTMSIFTTQNALRLLLR